MPTKYKKYIVENIPVKNKYKVKTSPLLPSHPSRIIMVGGSHSGKSTTLFNLLLNKTFPFLNLYKDDRIFVVSPTLKLETRWELVNVQEENTSDGSDIDEFIDEVLEKQEDDPKPAIIVLDDIIPMLNNSQKSGVAKLFISGRHYNLTSVLLSQGYRNCSKLCRLQISNLILFPVNKKEQQIVWEEHSLGYDLDEWLELYKAATDKKYSFLHINYANDDNERFIKNFETILQLE